MTADRSASGRVAASEVRALLRGADGPEASTSGPVAFIVAPHLRQLVDGLCSHLGRGDRATIAALQTWVVAHELVAEAHRHSLAAGGASHGQSLGGDAGSEDAHRMKETTGEVADRTGMSSRTVRRLGPVIGGERVGRDWQFDPIAVDAYVARRSA